MLLGLYVSDVQVVHKLAGLVSNRGSVLDILSPVTSDEVGRVLASSPAKSSTMDIIPTSLVLRCKAVFL